MNKKLSFTLIEMLLAMAIIGVVSAMAVSGFKNIGANEIKMRFQKCFAQLNKTVLELLNDETLYPNIPVINTSTGAPIRNSSGQVLLYGLSNFYETSNSGATTENVNKFSNAIYNKIGFKSKYAITSGTGAGARSFESKDKSEWAINPNTLKSSVGTGFAIITIDVNGTKSPNCPVTGNYLNTTVSTTCSTPDTFQFYVYASGEVKIPEQVGSIATSTYNQYNYLNVNKFLSSDK